MKKNKEKILGLPSTSSSNNLVQTIEHNFIGNLFAETANRFPKKAGLLLMRLKLNSLLLVSLLRYPNKDENNIPSSSSSLTFNVTRTQSARDNILFTSLRHCWTIFQMSNDIG